MENLFKSAIVGLGDGILAAEPQILFGIQCVVKAASCKAFNGFVKVVNALDPISLQLFGSEPQLMAEVAKEIEEEPFDILDINMGCPVPKVVNNGEGSALLKNPELIADIVKSVSSAISKPLTVKVRIGFEKEPVDIIDIVKRIEDAGAAAIAVHGRTRQQYYSGSADWETIARIKEAVSIPVIGNGDVDSPKKAEALFCQTGCDRRTEQFLICQS